MIIIVEDEEMIVDVVNHFMEDIEHIAAQSLEELIELPEDTIKKAVCIITDMNLKQGVSAYNVRNYVKGINPDIKVILMSGTPPDQRTLDIFEGFLQKPFLKDDLLKICDKYK